MVQQKWTKESITKTLVDWNSRGYSFLAKDLDNEFRGIYQSIKKEFGNIPNALDEAGIDYKDINGKVPMGYWTGDRIKKEIAKRLENGEKLNSESMRREEGGLFIAIYRRYGSWYNFLKAMGIDNPYSHNRRWSDERIKKEILDRRREGKSLVRASVKKDNIQLFKAVEKYWGTWEDSLEKIGLHEDEFKEKYRSKERIATALKQRFSLGKSLKWKDIKEDDIELYRGIQKFFKKKTTALEFAGIPTKKWDVNRIKKELLERKEQGLSMKQADIRRDNPTLVRQCLLKVGRWENVLKLIGDDNLDYTPRKPRGYWSKERIEEIMLKRKENGEGLRRCEVARDYPGIESAVQSQFGNWSKLLNKINEK